MVEFAPEKLRARTGKTWSKPQLREARRARLYTPRLFEHGDARENFSRAVVHAHALPCAQSARRVREDCDERVEDLRRAQPSDGREHHPAFDRRRFDAAEVHSRPLTRARDANSRAVYLHAAHAHALARGQQLHLVAFTNLARDERARHDRAEAAHRERAVNRQPSHSVRPALRRTQRGPAQSRLQLLNPLPRPRAHGDYGLAFEKRACDQFLRLGADEFEQLLVNRVGLRDDDEARSDGEQAADVEVLARLRHDALVRRDDERDEVDAVRARQHVLHEALVARHVNEPDAHVAEVEFRKPEVNRDAATLLLRQTVGVHARQRAHQSRLPVVNVSRRADDYRSHKNRKP